MKSFRFPKWSAIPGIALCLFAVACSKQEESQPAPRPVLSIRVKPRAAVLFGPFSGTIQPRYQSTTGFQIAGRIVTRNANVGDLVKAGQPLASLDPKLPLLSVKALEADTANARATLVNAQATEERKRKLLDDGTGGTSQAQVDDAIANRQTAQAALDQALAALRKAEEQVGYTQLRAEHDGVISAWNAEVGQVVSAGQAVVTVARPDIREAVFDVPVELVAQMQDGAPLTVSLLMDGKVSASGVIREITPLAESSTRSQRVRVSLNDCPEAFRLGTNVVVTQMRATEPVIEIPATAVLTTGGQSKVWIITSHNTVELREIVIARPEGDVVTVLKGLTEDDLVVTAGIHSLTTGQTVRQSKERSI